MPVGLYAMHVLFFKQCVGFRWNLLLAVYTKRSREYLMLVASGIDLCVKYVIVKTN
jgi:hypothetical protein